MRKRQKHSEQSEEERREIRQKYRALAQRIKDHQSEILNPDSDAFSECLIELNDLQAQVQHTSEAVPDGALLLELAELEHKKILSLFRPRSFSVADIIKQVTAKFQKEGGEEEDNVDWAALGRLAAPFCRSIPSISFMNGVLGSEFAAEKVAKERKKRQPKKDLPPPVVPTDLRNPGEEMKSATDKRVQALHALLPKDPTCFFAFVVDPDSFTRTVENMFDLSFLVKEGRASIDIGRETGLPRVQVAMPPDPTDWESGLEVGQWVMKLDMDTYKRVIEKFNIREAYRPPTRPARPEKNRR